MSGQANGLLSTYSLPDLVSLERRNFEMDLNMPENNVARQLYIPDTMDSSSKLYQESDGDTFGSLKREGTATSKARAGLGYDLTVYAKTIAKEISITLEMRQDRRDADIIDQFTSLGQFCPNRIELDLTHRLTFGTATSYTDQDGQTVDLKTADGLALFSASHTLKFSTTTYTNIVPNNPQFSAGALQIARKIMATQIFSNFGQKRVKRPNRVIIGDNPVLEDLVDQVLKSVSDPSQNNSGVMNPQNGRMTKVVLPYLNSDAFGGYDSTKDNYWFTASITGNAKTGWQAYFVERVSPQLISPKAGGNGDDIHTYDWTWSTYCRYAIAVVSGKGIVGSFPTN